MSENNTPTTYLKDYRPADFSINNVFLNFELFDSYTLVSAKIDFTKTNSSAADLILVGEQIQLISLFVNGSESSYEINEHTLKVNNVPDNFTLSTQVIIHPETNTSLDGLYRLGNTFSTQCEAQGFRKITYFLDRPDVMTKYQVRIEADKQKYPVLLSNGNLIEKQDLPNQRHSTIWNDPFVKPSYLFALVAGKLSFIEKTVKTKSGRDVLLQVYTEPNFIHQADFALDALHRSMVWDEQTFNLECDLDRYMIVAISDFNMGAMENKGLNIFNTQYVLADHKIATDKEYLNIAAVIAHEYFHNWTGNRVTCRDWFQLSLKEGLTVFRDSLFTADSTTKGLKRLTDSRLMREHQFLEDAGPMRHPVRPDNYIEINNFYTLTVYDKGAEVIRMMYNYVGAVNFKKGLELYFSRHDGHAVTVEDFVSAISDASNIDLSGQFFNWYTKSGTPKLNINTIYNDATKSFKIELRQSHNSVEKTNQNENENNASYDNSEQNSVNSIANASNDLFMIPITYRLFDTQGNTLSAENTVMLTKETQTLEFNSINKRPILSALRGFSAPVKVEFEQSESDLCVLLQYDDDLFTRYDTLIRLLKSQVKLALNGKEFDVKAIVDALTSIINSKTPAAEKAELLTLPPISVFYDIADKVDVINIYNSWIKVKFAITSQLKLELLKIVHTPKEFVDTDLSFNAVAERSFNNAALILLGNLSQNQISLESNEHSEEIIQLASDRYKQSTTMTNKIVALQVINQFDGAIRNSILDDFYENYKNEPRIVDKWLSLQATSTNEKCISQVEELAKHKAFSLSNPNKVRALVGGFANQNPLQFHRTDGKGYELLTDFIIKLDDINPSIAARLITPLTQYKMFSDVHKNLMLEQLQTIMNKPNLSKDVYEVVSKSLK